jgi:tRNA threonylcarbamoyladenosine biosynthesis protein TsaB
MSVFVAIETATELGSVAVGSGAALAGEVAIGERTRHAESLLPAVDFLLRTLRLTKADVAGVVVGAGPGSFTGVRVAAATARGLARGWGIPLYAYSSLAALACDVPAAETVCPLFDARRGEVYAACYRREQGSDRLATVMEPIAITVAELLTRLRGVQPCFVGDGAVRYAVELGIAAPALRLPRAASLLRLQAMDAQGGHVANAAGWEPSYLRDSGAERGVAG